MKDVKLDLSKFKHVKTDGFQTTLKHKDGHTISLAHHALSEATQKQLQALGGSAKAAQTPLQADEAHDQTKMAEGGKVPKAEHKGHKFEVRPAHNGAGHQLQHTNPKGEINTYHGFKDPKEAHAMAKSIAGEEEYAKGGKVEPKPKAQPQEPMQKPTVKKHEDPRFGNTTVIDNEDKRIGTVRQKFAKGTPNGPIDDTEDQIPDYLKPNDPAMPQDESIGPETDEITKELSMLPSKDEHAFDQGVPQLGGRQLPPMPAVFGGEGKLADMATYVPEMGGHPAPPPEAETPSAIDMSQPAAQPGQVAGPAPTPSEEVAQPAMPAQHAGMPDMGNMVAQGYNAAQRGAALQSQAEQGLGQEQAAIQGRAAEASQDAKDAFQDSYRETLQELHNHMQDVKEGQIDPDKYWTGDKDGNGSHSRVMAGIGMILAGFNPTSNPNAAINYIQHQIDKSVEAQSKNLDSKQNLVRANLEQFHNLKDATEMARLQQADVVNHYMDQAMATAKTPFARAALENAKSQIAQTYAPLAMTVAAMQGINKLSSNGQQDPDKQAAYINQMMIYKPELAKQMQERFVPGVGMAQVPIPQDVRKQLEAHQQLQMAAKDLDAYAGKHMGTLKPSERATAAQKALIVQAMFREGTLNTVYREGEQPLLDKAIHSSPTDFYNFYTTHPKLKEMVAGSQRQANVLKQSVGLPVSQPAAGPDQTAQAQAWLADPKNASSPHRAGVERQLKRLQGK